MDPKAPESEDDWARRTSAGVAAGSREALASLFERRFAFLLRVTRQRTRCDESFALDCVQDTMLHAARMMQAFSDAATLDAWLRWIVTNAALDRIRSEVARTRRQHRHVPGAEPPTAEPRCEELERVLRDLSDDERLLVRLRLERGLTLQQLARHLDAAPTAIESKLRRLLDRLRDRLGLASARPKRDSP